MEEHTPDWAKQLEVLRQKRGHTVKTDQISFHEETANEAHNRHIQNQYLHHWQKEHNANLSKENQNVCAQLILSDEWYEESQHILAHQEVVQEGVVRLDLSPTQEKTAPSTEPTLDLLSETTTEATTKTTTTEAILATVLKPDCHPQKPVAVVDEAVFVQHLSDKLSRHLHDVVCGMVKTEIRRHLQKMSLQLEDELTEKLPEMIKETIQHHVQDIIKEIK